MFDGRQPAQINRVEQDGADVDEAKIKRRRNLSDNLGLADTRCAPQEDGFADAG